MATKTERIIAQLLKDNPQLTTRAGKCHVKLYVNGRLVGIVPAQLRAEGLASNSRTQLRRAGLKVAV